MKDEQWMAIAIKEGMKGRVNAPPNPWVGCVIVKKNKKISTGFHPECGQPHAEIFALNNAGDRAKGSTVFITLEPCSHFGRTPPCVQALIRSGVARVVIGIKDPDFQVAGSGIASLKEAGIRVDVGVGKSAVKKNLAPYLHHRRTGKPFVIGKAALSIDGRVAAEDGSSQWISCERARADAHQLRAESQAILIGSGTAVMDSPKLTVRNVDVMPQKKPLRVVLDRSGKVPEDSPLFDQTLAPTLLFSNRKTSPNQIEVINETNLENILSILGKRNILQLLVEGGSSIMTQFLQQNLLNSLVIYTGPKVLGGNGLPVFQSLNIQEINQAKCFKPSSVDMIGDTIKTIYDKDFENIS